MSDEESAASDIGPLDRCLLVAFVMAMLLAVGIAAFLFRPHPADPICSKAEARCGDKSDVGAQ
jgi:hypothetical protein